MTYLALKEENIIRTNKVLSHTFEPKTRRG